MYIKKNIARGMNVRKYRYQLDTLKDSEYFICDKFEFFRSNWDKKNVPIFLKYQHILAGLTGFH